MTRVEKDITRFFEEVQAHIIVAGGQKVPEKELKEMTVVDLLEFVYPNAIRFMVYADVVKDDE